MQFKNEKNTRALFPPFIRQQNTSFVLNKKNPNNTYFFYSLSPRSPSLQTASLSLGHHLSRHLSLSQPQLSHHLTNSHISPSSLIIISRHSLRCRTCRFKFGAHLEDLVVTHLGGAHLEDSC